MEQYGLFRLSGKKNLFANAGDRKTLGQGRSPGKEMVTHASILTRNLMDRESCWATVHGAAKVLDIALSNNSNNRALLITALA